MVGSTENNRLATSMILDEQRSVIMEKKDSHSTTNTSRYLANQTMQNEANNATTTIIKQSPTSPTPMDVQQHQQQSRDQIYSSTTSITSENHNTATNSNHNENLDLTTSQHHSHLHPAQHQQQHQTNLRLNPSNNSNSNILINCTQNVAYPRHKHELPLPLTTSMADCQLTPTAETASIEIMGHDRPPPPSYHTTALSSAGVGKLYHPNTSASCTNEMDSMVSSATDALTAPVATRLSAYEQFLKLSAHEYSTVAESAALNLSSAAAAAAAMAAAAVANVTAGAVSNSNSSLVEGIGGGGSCINVLSSIGIQSSSLLNNSTSNDLSASLNVCERN